MKGGLRRLGHASEEHQAKDGKIEGAGADDVALAQDRLHVPGSGDLMQEDEPDEHGHPAAPGDEEGLGRSVA
jgi:hypothetical protein